MKRRNQIIAVLLTGALIGNSVSWEAFASENDISEESMFSDGSESTGGEVEEVPDENSKTDNNIKESFSSGDVNDAEAEFEDGESVSANAISDSGITENPAQTGDANTSIDIPDTAEAWNGHYYQIYDNPMDWYEAKTYCESLGGHLATVTNEKEQEVIEKILGNGTKNFYWLGAVRDSSGSFSKWVTGEPINYTHFDTANGEPNNYTGSENALTIYRLTNPLTNYNGALKWNDLQTDGDCRGEEFFGVKNSGFICEWDLEDFQIENGVLIAYTGADEEVTVPDGVTEIGSKVFLNNTTAKKITLPETVTKIDTEAFRGCSALQTVNIPSGVTEIGNNAFYNCSSLKQELVLPEGLTMLGSGAFYNCSSLTGLLSIPDGLTEIKNYTFYNCSSLKGTLNLPENLKTIEYNAFSGCSGFSGDLIIPNSVTTVGESAFSDCSGFDGTLTLSKNLTAIEKYVFDNCYRLKGTLILPEKIKSVDSQAFYNCSGFSELVVGKGVTNICSWDIGAFKGCSGIITMRFLGTKVPILNYSINDSHTTGTAVDFLLGYQGLSNLQRIIVPEGCYSSYNEDYGSYLQNRIRIIEEGSEDLLIKNGVLLAYTGDEEEVIVPNGVTEISTRAFINNTTIKKVTLPETVEKIGEEVFRECSALEEVNIPPKTTEIGDDAFADCVKLKKVELSENLEKLGDRAFYNCKGLTGDLVIPNKVKIIGARAFDSCINLNGKLTLSHNLEEIKGAAFYNCRSLTGNLDLPESLKKIRDSAFDGCYSLNGDLMIPDSVEAIGNYAFQNCYGFKGKLKLSKNLTQLNEYVFYNCNGLTGTVTIPDNVKRIGNEALGGCNGLEELIVGKGVTNIYACGWSNAWQGCNSLETITFLGETVPVVNESLTASSSNASYLGNLFNLKKLKKIIVPKGCYSSYSSEYGSYLQSYTRIIESGGEDFLIEDGVLTAYIGEDEEVTIPDSVTEIGTKAFLNNTEVRKITLPETVEKIGNESFRGCSNLEEIALPSGLKEIGNSAFYECTGLKKAELPENLEKLGESAFYDCGSLTGNLVIPKKIKTIESNVFYNCSSLDGNLILSENLERIGYGAFYNCRNLMGRLELPGGLKVIDNAAFIGCYSLSGDLVIPDSVETVGDTAFFDCYGFKGALKLSENLTQLNSYAFYNCSGLTGTVTIPDNVKKIESEALGNCSGLTDLIVGKGVTNIYGRGSTWTAWQGCNNLETITFLGETVPVINESLTATSSDMNSIGYLFDLKNLKTIYVTEKSLEQYKSAWSAYVPETVTFSVDALQLPISNFMATHTGSHSVELSWAPSVSSDIEGYHIYRDGELLGDTVETTFKDSSLETGQIYQYSIKGYTEDGRTTKETKLEITTQAPKIISIYTDNKLNKLGQEKGNLYALVKDTGNLKGATGSFYYLDEELNRHEIGTKLTKYSSSNKDGAVYKTTWDLSDFSVGTYTVYFELTDADNESDIASQAMTVDDSVPEALTSVVAVGDTNQIVLSWTMAHEIDTVRYYIYRKAENEDEYTLIKKVYDRNTLSYVDTKAKENQKYYYYITGVNSFGVEGKPSDVAVATPLTDTEAPRVVQLTPVNGSIIGGNVELYANAQDNVAVVKTELYISEDDGQTWNLLKSTNNSYCSYTLSTKEYEDKIISIKGLAYDARGNVSTPLIYKYKIDNTGPEKVTGLSYESTATTVTLRWNDVADNDLAFFRVERKKEDGSFEKVDDIKSTLGINIYNLESDKEYVYRVVAYDQQGNRGEESDEITVKTQPDTIAPVITSIQPNANYYNKEIPLRITATDNTGVARMTIQTSTNTIVWKDYKSLILSGTNKTETVSETISLENMPEGDLYIRAIAEDAAGNKSDSSENAPYVQYIVDRTAPDTPKNLKADAITGAIQITWDMGTENDIDGYQVLRSTDGEDYTVIADGLHSVNYWDRSAEKDVTYWYKVAVSDQAGNISAATEPVKSILPEDNEPPKIESFAPTAGSTIGISNSRFSVMASDNWKVDKISVNYTVNDNETVKTLINETGINNYYKVVSADIPLDTLKDGDILHLSISVTDIQGMTVSKDGITYTIDKTAPRVNSVSTESAEDRITVRWTGNAEDDLAGYKVYRKTANGSYTLIAQRSAASGTEYQYEDYNALAKETYYYKIEAVDKYGNTRSKESEAAWITVKPTVSANLSCDKVLELNTEYYFDASDSYSDIGMKSYKFDFGDGTVIEGSNAKVIHRYTEIGTYTVHLTVIDEQGNQSEIEKQITVEEPKLLGTVKVKAVDASGNAIADMPVYFDMDTSSDNIKYTGSDGMVTFTAGAGSYTIGSYADGYLPVKKSVVLKAGAEVELTLTVVKEPVVTGQFEINRMTLDEIKAAGIDVSDPANQQVVKVTLHLVYGSTPIIMNVITNGNKIYSGETTIVDTGEEKRQLTATVISTDTAGDSTGTGSGTGIGNAGNNVIIAIMDVPVEASCLKEFFDVKLHILNHADTEFELTNNTVKLNVPDGMTLMDSNYTTADSTVYFDSLKGQEEKTISWILRGDKAGEYDLTADYTAILQQFNAAVTAQFKTDTPITVYGLNAMKLVADINKQILYGGMYFNLSLQNVGGADMNLPALNVDGKIQSLYEKKAGDAYSSEDQIPDKEPDSEKDENSEEKKEREVNLLDVLLKNTSGYSQSLGKDGNVEKLSSGETLTKKYVSYNATSEDIAYLQKAVAEVASDLGIQVEINMVDMDLFSIDDADDKANSFFTDKNKFNWYKFFIDNKNFHYYVDAENDDENYLKRLGMTIYGLSDFVFTWDTDIFTHKNMKDMTRNYVAEMLKDESFQTAVDNKVDDTYLKTAKKVISVINGALPEDKSDVLYEEETVDNIKDALKESKNIRSLASSLKSGGTEAFWERVVTLTLSVGGSTGVEYLKAHVQQDQVAGWLGSAMSGQLSEISSILSVFSNASVAWNTSVEMTNQLVTINAAQYESMLLMDMLLSHNEINQYVYEELQEINEGLLNGFKTQSDIFIEEFLKAEIKGGTTSAISKTIGLIGKTYYPKSYKVSGTVFLALQLAFGAFDYTFGWGDSVSMADSLRVAASLTYALRSETINRQGSGDNEGFLMALKYLIKIRIIGETTWVDLCKDQGAKEVKPGFDSDKPQALDEYIAVFKSTVLSYRDSLFGEVSETYNVPEAPKVYLNYSTETTFDTYDGTYEYSFNGTDWITCDGNAIPLNPGTVGRHLWVRVKATENNLSGNITKVYVPARPALSGDIKARYKKGTYYIEGLSGKAFYQLSEGKLESVEETQELEPEDGKVTLSDAGEYHPYLALVLAPEANAFRSSVRNIVVEKAKKITFVNDENMGEVSGEDEYFEGEVVQIKAEAKEGYDFIGWYEDDKLLSDQPEYSFECYSDHTIETRYEETKNVKVTFTGWNQSVLREDKYVFDLDDASKIVIPKVLVPDGYEFIGWKLSEQVYAEDKIQEVIYEKLIEQKEICISAQFKQKDEKHTITVINGKLADGKTTGEYQPSTFITVKADDAKEGEKFAYWKKNGVIASYEKVYQFYMPNMDTELEAIYEKQDATVEITGVSYMESTSADINSRKMTFVSIGTVPDGCSIEMSGIVATSDSDKAINGIALTSKNADYVRGGGSGLKTYKCTWIKGNVTDNQVWYVRSYLKYHDNSGTVYEIYGDVCERSFSTNVVFKGWNNGILTSSRYLKNIKNIDDIVVPNVLVPDGYEFAGWMLEGQMYSDEEIKTAIYNRLTDGKEIVIGAKFKQKEEKYKLSIINGTLPDGKTEGLYNPATLISVIANEAEDGKTFAYWKKNGIIAGYDKRYEFYMPSQDTNLEAVYETLETPIEVKGVTYIESVNSDINTKKLTFVSIGTVPENCQIEYAGVVATSDHLKATEGTELTAENADYVRGGGKSLKTYKCTWIKSNVSQEQTWYVRAYLKYSDANGEIHEIYSDTITAKLE